MQSRHNLTSVHYLYCFNLLILPVTLRTTLFNIKKFYVVTTWNLYVLYGSRDKQQNLSYTKLKRLVFMTVVESVYSAVRTDYLYKADCV
jgi:hypothetical protein